MTNDHRCVVCGAWGPYGFGYPDHLSQTPKKWIGVYLWACADHRKEVKTIAEEKFR